MVYGFDMRVISTAEEVAALVVGDLVATCFIGTFAATTLFVVVATTAVGGFEGGVVEAAAALAGCVVMEETTGVLGAGGAAWMST